MSEKLMCACGFSGDARTVNVHIAAYRGVNGTIKHELSDTTTFDSKPTVEPALMRRFAENPDHRQAFGSGLMDALAEVVTTCDYNATFPGSTVGRSMALDALKHLQLALEEAYNIVPGVDIPSIGDYRHDQA